MKVKRLFAAVLLTALLWMAMKERLEVKWAE